MTSASPPPSSPARPPVDPWARTAETKLSIGTRRVGILHPFRSDDLISEDDYVRDERLPYWADIWPASRVLAEEILATTDAEGKSLLELGCGLGVVSLAALMAGFSVLATDYYKPALEFAERNATENRGGKLRTLHWNWRDPFPLPERFDYVIASDVLYEKEYGALVSDILHRLLKPGGTAVIADPGRIAAQEFLGHCAALKLNFVGHKRVAITDDGRDQTVNIYRFIQPAARV